MDFVATFIFWLVPTTLYFGPSILAVCRNHYRTKQIILVNLLLGWTIVGLFVTFAWALSSTRDRKTQSLEDPPTDFSEILFRNRNIVRQPDGGAIIYPGLLAEEAYWLNGAEFKTYLQMRADEARRNFPRGLLIFMAGVGPFLAFRQWMGPEHGTAPALVVFSALVLIIAIWELALRPRRQFRNAFPKAPRTKDPIRKKRKVLAGLIAFDPSICFGATLLCGGLIASSSAAHFLQGPQLILRAHDGAIFLMGFAILGGGFLFYGHLAWHHLVFLCRHRRTPAQLDLDELGTGVKPTRKPASTQAASGTAGPETPSAQDLAAALRYGLRES
jgi:Superinfection immunity protein